MEDRKIECTVKRIDSYLNRVAPIVASAGQVPNYALSPVIVEFYLSQ